MKTETKTITPEYAQTILLEQNTHNRTLRARTVTKYASDMKRGDWMVTHQGIAFYEDGSLADGQHRLSAVVQAGIPVEMLVTTGMPKKESRNGSITTLDAIDRGAARSIANQLQLAHGIKSATNVSATMNQITLLVMPSATQPTVGIILFLYEIYGQAFEALFQSNDRFARNGYIIAPLCMYYKSEPENALRYMKQFSTLENLSQPVRSARRWVERHHKHPDQTMRVIATSLHYFHDNRELEKSYASDDGRNWLLSLSPTIVRRIRQAVMPLPAMSAKAKAENPTIVSRYDNSQPRALA